MTYIRHFVPTSEHDFLSLQGDLTERVKVTLFPREERESNAWYWYARTINNGTLFLRQLPSQPELLETIECSTPTIQFDKQLGAIPTPLEYTQETIQPCTKDYAQLQQILAEAKVWTPLKLTTTGWQFITE